jgi:hypothetical protein
MTDVKISQLPAASLPLTGSEECPIVQDGTTVKALIGAISARTDTIATLKTLSPASYDTIYVGGYRTVGDGGGGFFYGSAGFSPGHFTDNGGTIILPTGGNGSSAWVRIPEPMISVKAFGAYGDGSNNDTTYIQKALDYADGSTIYFPEGTYLVTTTLLFDGSGRGYVEGPKVIGETRDGTIIDNRTGGPLFSVTAGTSNNDYVENILFSNFRITNSLSQTTTTGIKLSGVRNGTIQNLFIDSQGDHGIHLYAYATDATNVVHLDISQCEMFNCSSTGIYCQGDATLGGVHAAVYIRQSRLIANAYGIIFESMQTGTIESCAIARNHVYGVLITRGQSYSKNCIVLNNEFDSNGDDPAFVSRSQIYLDYAENIQVNGNYFIVSTVGAPFVQANKNITLTANALNINITNNLPRVPAGITGVAMYSMSAAATYVTIADTDWSAWSTVGNTKYSGTPTSGYIVIDSGRYLTGVSFSSTPITSSDPYTISQYVRTSWTPVVSASVGFTATPLAGSTIYTRIGNLVSLEGIFYGTYTGAGPATITFSIPFNTISGLSGATGAVFDLGPSLAVGAVVDFTSASSDQVRIYVTAGGAFSAEIHFTYTYTAA